jgi:hypothetical protein
MKESTYCVRIALALLLIVLVAASAPVSVSALGYPDAQSLELASAGGISHGVHLRPTYNYGNELGAFNVLAGRSAGMLMFFSPWSPFDAFLLNQLRDQLPVSQRPVIVISWEPGRSSTGCNLAYGGVGPLRAIAQGNCDAYIRGYARSLGARPERYILRFAHEMNITDSPWWVGYFGKNPADYVAAFRRVHDLFRSENVANVEFAWSPNYASNPYNSTDYAWNSIHNYYPGDAYVDWIGLSGYNWGKPWRTFDELYDEVLRDVSCRYAKPQLMLEVGSVEGPGGTQTKAYWMQDMFTKLPKYPFMRGVVWFNDYAYATRGQPDFRITTSTADVGSVQSLSNWTSTYRSLVTGPAYVDQLPSVSQATPPRTICVLEDQVQISPRVAIVAPGGAVRFVVTGVGLEESLTVTIEEISTQRLGLPTNTLTLLPPWDSAEIRVQSYASTPLGTYHLIASAGGLSIPLEVKVVSTIHRLHIPAVRQGR